MSNTSAVSQIGAVSSSIRPHENTFRQTQIRHGTASLRIWKKRITLGGETLNQEINEEIDLMRLVKCGVTFLACSAAVVAGASTASARPQHHQRHAHVAHHHANTAQHRVHRVAAGPNANFGGPGSMPVYAPVDGSAASAAVPRTERARKGRSRRAAVASAPSASLGGFSSNALVAEARRYLGTNPTSRRTLWCGAFVDKVLRETGHKGGGNLAKGYLSYGRRVSGPEVGAIAVMGRKGGGHVGVVSGVDPNGNPIIVSGNHNNTVAESVYPRHRVIAYIKPNG